MIPIDPAAPRSASQQREPQTLADLGEWELIRRLGAFAPPGQFADDAALLALDPAQAGTLVVNTDVLVEDLHFSDATTSPADVGWRATAANLSDLAAMGATEVVGITVGLVAPPHTRWSWVEGVYAGIGEALQAHGGLLLGGDCSGGCQRLLAITAIGRLAAPDACAASHRVWPGHETGRNLGAGESSGPVNTRSDSLIAATAPGSGSAGAIRRGDGRPGDQLLCTGPHGLSRLGLALLLGEPLGTASASGTGKPSAAASAQAAAEAGSASPDGQAAELGRIASQTGLDPALVRRAIQAHRRPVPRFDGVRALITSRPAGQPWRVGGCDSSDGLAAAVAAIAAASGCAAQLDRSALPLDPAMRALAQAEAWCLGGGEDFELVLALDPHWGRCLSQLLPGCRLIGSLTTGEAGALSWSQGEPWPDAQAGGQGFRHFG